ncbi:hypothetical protein CBS101457_005893 [Exobasidium rhododendri]|nr:hypothetical protein CBS101457_005893 [Exobasidium rhododendri]
MANPTRILLQSDDYSPNATPHSLPALHWSGLFTAALQQSGPDWVEDQLREHGWDPQWRFSMYSQAHYHSTTHELLVVIASSANIQLGGTDERAKPKNSSIPTDSCETLTLGTGDALLLPAGYSHRLLQGKSNFTMIGSYPTGGTKWDSE